MTHFAYCPLESDDTEYETEEIWEHGEWRTIKRVPIKKRRSRNGLNFRENNASCRGSKISVEEFLIKI